MASPILLPLPLPRAAEPAPAASPSEPRGTATADLVSESIARAAEQARQQQAAPQGLAAPVPAQDAVAYANAVEQDRIDQLHAQATVIRAWTNSRVLVFGIGGICLGLVVGFKLVRAKGRENAQRSGRSSEAGARYGADDDRTPVIDRDGGGRSPSCGTVGSRDAVCRVRRGDRIDQPRRVLGRQAVAAQQSRASKRGNRVT